MKVLLVLSAALALLGGSTAIVLYTRLHTERTTWQQTLVTAEARTSELETQLTASHAAHDELQRQLVALDADLGQAKSRLLGSETRNVQLTRECVSLREQVGEIATTRTALETDLATSHRELAQLREAVTAASPAEVERYRQTIGTLQTRVQELDLRLANTHSGSTSAPTASALVAAQPVAQIMSVGPENAFVVVDCNETPEIRVGTFLRLDRRGETLAEARISDVRAGFAIAQVAPDSLRGVLQKGDSALILPPY